MNNNDENDKKGQALTINEKAFLVLQEEINTLCDDFISQDSNHSQRDSLDTLKEHSGIINKIMLHVLSDHTRCYGMESRYILALRAQDQCRRTFETISKIEFEREKGIQLRNEMDRRWQLVRDNA